jgi:uncharacterized membrane protein (UPF0127 family)
LTVLPAALVDRDHSPRALARRCFSRISSDLQQSEKKMGLMKHSSSHRKFLGRFVAVLLFACCAVLLSATTPARAFGQDTIDIVTGTGVHAFSVELATNDAERALGLMFRKELPEGHGMLFDYQTERQVRFWMHNTYIPLDMIFIAADGRIVHIAENAKPMSDDGIPSVSPIRGVLEVIAGTVRKFGIATGDRVTGSIFGKGGEH